ncbi:MAG: hypothetical protein AB4041_02135 [Microcystaceae cyanobacterium]
MNTYSSLLPPIDQSDRSSEQSQPMQFQWCYAFQDGSQLKGTIESHPEQLSARWLKKQHIEADYLDKDGKTVLLHWDGSDFVCFDLTEKGELLIIASKDNFVGNSMCLVYSPIRSRAQVTEQGSQWVGEAFSPNAWSLKAKEDLEAVLKADWSFNMNITPVFPFLSVDLNLHSTQTATTYQWTYFPYYCWFPWFKAVSPST